MFRRSESGVRVPSDGLPNATTLRRGWLRLSLQKDGICSIRPVWVAATVNFHETELRGIAPSNRARRFNFVFIHPFRENVGMQSAANSVWWLL